MNKKSAKGHLFLSKKGVQLINNLKKMVKNECNFDSFCFMFYSSYTPRQQSFVYTDFIPCRDVRPTQPKDSVLGTTPKYY